jgi:parvulin-like peptidyl-prolyl isomerase
VLPFLACVLGSFLVLGEESLVVRPMHRGAQPPQVRSARHILLRYDGAVGAPDGAAPPREEAIAGARSLVARARAGSDFEQLAAEHSADPDARIGAVLGTFAPGMLTPALDAFLFSAEIGAVSDPLVDDRGVHVLQRIESHAAVRQILVRGSEEDARVRCAEIAGKLREGADFAELARARSEDAGSAARGGQFAIYERGPADSLLKSAAFRLRVGEVSEPIRTPLGWHLLQRVAPETLDPALAEPSFVRLRGILLRVDESTPGARDRAGTFELAQKIHERLRSGEDMRALAREFDEDTGGKEREGDLGWIHRGQPGLARELKRACLLKLGEMAEPQPTRAGYLVVRRER